MYSADKFIISNSSFEQGSQEYKLSDVGKLLTKRYPDFDSRGYGYHKLSDLITASSLFETSRRSLPNNLSTETFLSTSVPLGP